MDTIARTKFLATEQGLTLFKLAEKCGVAYCTLRNTERRGGQLQVETIERICQGLGITLAEFFTEPQAEPSST